ncbi:hypothetical protein KUCAC02_023420 [Chaenocephalus aceratus]|uniref:Uncharacterized protein n=1 Tax=Chaenocephalus aceratus TaxID=36190 RepID=A0ACB9XQX8_CHAAC|nr:hypothetical protein KUCAC02_023420 [Chaenocephalus aceratus]
MLYTLAGGGTLCGTLEVLHQPQMPCPHHNCGLLGCHPGLMLLAVLSCFAGVVLGLSAFTNGTKNRRVRTGGIALVFSALLALAIYTGVTVTFFGKRFLDWRFAWSYFIAWVAIILAFTAGVFQLCAYQRTTAEPAPSNNQDT